MDQNDETIGADWLLMVRRLRALSRRGVNTTGALDGLIGPLAMSDEDMPAYLEELVGVYGAPGTGDIPL